jgi:hypothetical protein
MPMEKAEAPGITKRSFDITLYSTQGGGEADTKIFEGRTTSLQRAGLKALVNQIGKPFEHGRQQELDSHKDWIGRSIVAEFHAITPVLDEVQGEIVDVEESSDARYRWYLESKFDEELNLLELQL